MNRTNSGLAQSAGARSTPNLAAVLTAGNAAGTKKITGVVDPTNPQDVATKAYVDAATPVAPNLASVLSTGSDTGGIGIINDTSITTGSADASIAAFAASLDTADASQAATTVDGLADATGTVTATGLGNATVKRTATTENGNANSDSIAQSNVDGTASSKNSAIALGGDANATSLAQTFAAGGISNANNTAISILAGVSNANNKATSTDGNAFATLTAIENGTGIADARSIATSPLGTISFGPVADSTGFGLQCNGSTLYTQATGAPSVFTSLFYRDTTAVTGRMYMWDFVTAAYVPISGVF